jgi:1-acyl-sn-glycerol-3-phosphate acyltransferase
MPGAGDTWASALDAPAYAAARSEAAVIKIARDLAQQLHPRRRSWQNAGLDSSLDRDWGFDSLSRAELLLRIERAFATRLPEKLLGEVETLRDLVAALAVARAVPPAPPDDVARAPATGAAQPAPDTAATLTEILDWHAQRHPDRPHVVLLDGDGGESVMTYRDLARRAQAVAGGLVRRRLEPGERVALMLPTSLDFFAAFFGILYAGGVPVPIYPPMRLSQIEEHLRRQAGILRNAGAAMLITVPEALSVARLLKLQVESLRGIDTVEHLSEAAGGALPPQPRAGDLAMLQYTSGSTGDPNGVTLSHANLLANIRAMGEAMDAGPADVCVSWLPLYHDMGLIGAWLCSLTFAAPLVVMSPLTFLVRPEQWLWAIHRHRGTVSAAPNFAFELCLRKIEDSAIVGLDLSSLRMVGNGAEAVSPDTIRRFTARFAPYGFRAEAMAPVYGLAECAVGLAFPPLGRGPVIDRVERAELSRHGRATPAARDSADALEIVACGRPLPGHQIRVVDATGEVGERREGRLQFRGPSATSGYFANPDKTRALFDGPWLNSGDRAYVAGGDVFITGRSKDIVIRAGRNIYPEEIETVVGGLDGIRKGCVAVFGTPDPRAGTERLVVAAETRLTDPAALATARERVAEAVAQLLDAPPDDVLLVGPGSVPKTSSGKLRRAAARELFERGRLGQRPPSQLRQLARLVLSGLAARLRFFGATIGRLGYGLWWWFLVVVSGAIVWPLVVLTPGVAWRWHIARRAARLVLRLMAIPVTVSGRLKAGATQIIAANHCSYLDSLVLAAVLPGQPAFVAKKELGGQLIAGPFLRALGTLFVERDDAEVGVEDTRRVLEAARAGRTLVFFPEGTFTRVSGLRPFRLGAFTIAARQRIGTLPLTLRGTRSILRGEQWLARRGAVSVQIGEPIAADGDDFAAAVRLRDRVRAAILERCDEPDLGQG